MCFYLCRCMKATSILNDTGYGAAFKALFDWYWGKLYLYTLNCLKLEADTRDVMQESMINLWVRRSGIQVEK